MAKHDDTSKVGGLTKEQWLDVRRMEAHRIDADNAEVRWQYAQTLDPYGVEDDLPKEYQQVGRVYFARSPDSDIWVWFGDLPLSTSEELWDKHKANLAFPAGLPSLPEDP